MAKTKTERMSAFVVRHVHFTKQTGNMTLGIFRHKLDYEYCKKAISIRLSVCRVWRTDTFTTSGARVIPVMMIADLPIPAVTSFTGPYQYRSSWQPEGHRKPPRPASFSWTEFAAVLKTIIFVWNGKTVYFLHNPHQKGRPFDIESKQFCKDEVRSEESE